MSCMFLDRLSAAFSADDSIIRATVCESLVCDGDVCVCCQGGNTEHLQGETRQIDACHRESQVNTHR